MSKNSRKDVSRETDGQAGGRAKAEKRGKTSRKEETSSKCVSPERWHLWTIRFSTTQTHIDTLVFGPCVCLSCGAKLAVCRAEGVGLRWGGNVCVCEGV